MPYKNKDNNEILQEKALQNKNVFNRPMTQFLSILIKCKKIKIIMPIQTDT